MTDLNTFKSTARRLADLTRDAYSHERYGHEEWLACAEWMLAMGLHEDEVHAVLWSRHMRAAADLELPDVRSFSTYWVDLGLTKTQLSDLVAASPAYYGAP